MATIPARCIKFKEYDFVSEIFETMSIPEHIAGLDFYPPSIGMFSLFEMIDSKFIMNFSEMTGLDFARSAYIAYFGESSAEKVRDWRRGGGGDDDKIRPFDIEACEFVNRHNIAEFENILKLRKLLISNAFNGYEMIPDRGDKKYEPHMFGAPTIASCISIMSGLGLTPTQIIWEVPLVLIGHMAAVKMTQNGEKNVGRPKDTGDIKQQLKEGREREERGELHPWQIEDPVGYPPEHSAIKLNPTIEATYNKYLEEWKAKKDNG